MTSIEVPGKVLLLGEYSVLVGGPALLASVPVRFRYGPATDAAAMLRMHPDSPAGRATQKYTEVVESGDVSDAARAPGLARSVEGGSPLGLGSSTADFIAVVSSYRSDASWQEAWTFYRDLHLREAVPPSGADLVAQWNGGVGVFRLAEAGKTAEWRSLAGSFERVPVILLQASHQEGRKTATHDHLARMKERLPEFVELGRIAEDGVTAFEGRDWSRFAARLQEFSDWLQARGFEHPMTAEDRLALKALSGVRAVKGCGAMLSDSLVVVTDGSAETEAQVRSLALARDLHVLQSGIPMVAGRTLG